VSWLQKRILRWLVAAHQRTNGLTASSPQELVRPLQRDKGNLTHSLRPLEAGSWMGMGRSPAGKPHISPQKAIIRSPRLREVVMKEPSP
jgi:hypothetical protein